MKLIGINGNEANVSHRVGIGQYAFELLKHMNKLQIANCELRIYLQNKPMEDMTKENEHWKYSVIPGKGLWTMTALQVRLLLEKSKGKAPNVFFTPGHYAPLMMPIPSVISIMDMSFERFPQFFKKKDLVQLKYWTRLSAIQAKKILTISQFSKREICDIYGLSPEKVEVTYPGYDVSRFNPKVKTQKSKIKNVINKYKIKSPYLLFLGTLQPRKNLERLVQAFSELQTNNYELVVVGMIDEGRGGWMYKSIFDKVKALGLENRVVFTGYAPDEDVPFLMAGSLGYLLPSIYEGFGIPPIEAMATGVPVVVSRVSSLSEICGEAAIYIDDPFDVASIKEALDNLLGMNKEQLENRVKIGLEWVKRYNWEVTAKQTLKVLTNV